MINKTLYELLGVEVDATETQIKRAYRKLAKRAHPDKGGDPEKFREITHAYEVLTDPERRKLYNETGSAPDAKKSGPDPRLATVLGSVIMQAIQQNPHGCNPVDIGRKVLNNRIAHLNGTATGDLEIVRRCRHIAANVTKTTEGDNIIANVLESHATGAETHAKQMKDEAEMLAQVLKLLDDYGWKPDAESGSTPPREMRRIDLSSYLIYNQ